jgi:hypothetical protein
LARAIDLQRARAGSAESPAAFRKVSAYGTRAFLGVVDIVEVAANERKRCCRRFYPAAATLTGSRERGALDDGSNSFWPRHIDGMAFLLSTTVALPWPFVVAMMAPIGGLAYLEWYFWRCFPRTRALPILFRA